MLNRIEIRNFKAIQDEECSGGFTLPQSEIVESSEKASKEKPYYQVDGKWFKYKPMILDGLTNVNYLVGENGCGKSSVLESLHFISLLHPLSPSENLYNWGTSFNKPHDFIFICSSNRRRKVVSYTWEYLDKIKKSIVYDKLLFLRTDVLASQIPHFPYNNLGDIFHGGFENASDEAMKSPQPFFVSGISKDFYPSEDIKSDICLSKLAVLEEKFLSEKLAKEDAFTRMCNKKLSESKNKLLPIRKNPKILSHFINNEDFWEEMKEFDSGLFNFFNSIKSKKEASASGKMNLLLFTKLAILLHEKKLNYILIEEPEISLHSSYAKLFPKLLSFFCYLDKDVQFIISTHSPFIVNAALQEENQNVYHLEGGQCLNPEGLNKSLGDTESQYQIFDSLGFKASDYLYSNGVILVEGPHDAHYIELWLKLYQDTFGENQKKVKKDRDYTFQFLSPILSRHIGTFEEDFAELGEINFEKDIKPIVNILKSSRNVLIVFDKDTDYDLSLKPSQYKVFPERNVKQEVFHSQGKNKARLIHEVLEAKKIDESILETNDGVTNDDKLAFWINEGTVETYFKDISKIESLKDCEKIEKYGYFVCEDSQKNKCLKIFSELVYKKNIKFENLPESLRSKIQALHNTIQTWNS